MSHVVLFFALPLRFLYCSLANAHLIGVLASGQQSPLGWIRATRCGEAAADGVLLKQDGDFVPRTVRTGASNYRVVEVLDGLEEGATLGIPMVSRLKQDNDLLDSRVRGSRSFGGGSSQKPKKAGGGSSQKRKKPGGD